MTEETKELVARLRRGAEHLEREGDMGLPLLLTSAADLIDHLVLTSNEVKAGKVGSGAALDDDMPTIWEDPAGKGYPCFERPMTGAECAALIDKQADEIERLKATPPQVPDGYVIVPKVPAEAMAHDGWMAMEYGDGADAVACWNAMIAAAPEQPASAAGCERGIEDAIRLFREALPGWWYSLGECEVSCDASCAPTRLSPDLVLIPRDERFNSGFHIDVPQPSTLAEALAAVMTEAIAAREALSAPDASATEREG